MSERGIGDKEVKGKIIYRYDSNPNECSLTIDNTKPMCTVQTNCKSRMKAKTLHQISP